MDMDLPYSALVSPAASPQAKLPAFNKTPSFQVRSMSYPRPVLCESEAQAPT